jgi:Major Facilitator Superfamily
VAALLIAAAVEGICVVFYNTAEVTSVPRIVSHELLPVAIAKNEARSQAALLAGRPLGAMLFAINRGAPYALDVLAGIATILSLRRIDKRRLDSATHTEPGLRPTLRRGLEYLIRDRFLRNVLAICTVTNFLFQITIMYFVVAVKNEHESGFVIGIILAASGFGGLIGASIAPRVFRFVRPRNIMFTCVFVWLLFSAVIVQWSGPIAMVVAWGGIGFVGAHVNVALTLYQSSNIGKQLLAHVASASSFVTRCATAVGALCAGYIVSKLGPSKAAELVFGSMFVIAAGVGIHRLTRRPEPHTECFLLRPSTARPKDSVVHQQPEPDGPKFAGQRINPSAIGSSGSSQSQALAAHCGVSS